MAVWLAFTLVIWGCTDSSLSTIGPTDEDAESESESESESGLDGDFDGTEEDGQVDGDGESEEAEPDSEVEDSDGDSADADSSDGDLSETEEAEPDVSCTPNTTWCNNNVLHTCNDQGQEHVPQDCGTDTCVEDHCRAEWALAFDGTGYVTLSDTFLVRRLDSATVEAWVNWSGMGDQEHIYSEGRPSKLVLKVRSTGALHFAEWVPPNDWPGVVTQPGSLGTGWHHVAGVKDGIGYAIYVDGRLVGYSQYDHQDFTYPDEDPSFLGMTLGNSFQPEGFLHGAIDELRLSSIARYTEDFTPPIRHEADDDTIALWRMDEGDGQTTTDEVEGREGTLEGGVDWTVGVSERNLENR